MTHFWDSRKQSAVDAAKPFGTFQRNAKCQTGLTRWGGKKNSFFFYIVSFFKVFCSTQKQIMVKEKNLLKNSTDWKLFSLLFTRIGGGGS